MGKMLENWLSKLLEFNAAYEILDPFWLVLRISQINATGLNECRRMKQSNIKKMMQLISYKKTSGNIYPFYFCLNSTD